MLPIGLNAFRIFQSNEDFQFPSGMKIVGDNVWAVSCQLQNHFTSAAMNRKSIKYRVLVGRIDELIKGTGCDKRLAPAGSQFFSAVKKPEPQNTRILFRP